MKNQFSDFYLELSWKFIENWGDLSTKKWPKITPTLKIKIGNFIFLSIHPIPDLSGKYEHFLKKKIIFAKKKIKYWDIFEEKKMGGPRPTKKHPGPGYFL